MKKTYSKPALYAERFELAAHIAACSGYFDGAATHTRASNCAFQLGTQFVFMSSITDCALQVESDDYGIDCYNGPFLEIAGQPFSSQ